MKAIGSNVTGVQGDVAKLADLDRLYETVSTRLSKRKDESISFLLTPLSLNFLPW